MLLALTQALGTGRGKYLEYPVGIHRVICPFHATRMSWQVPSINHHRLDSFTASDFTDRHHEKKRHCISSCRYDCHISYVIAVTQASKSGCIYCCLLLLLVSFCPATIRFSSRINMWLVRSDNQPHHFPQMETFRLQKLYWRDSDDFCFSGRNVTLSWGLLLNFGSSMAYVVCIW